MKKRLIIVGIMFVAALLISPGGEKLRASGHETHYEVYYECSVGPDVYLGQLVGMWDVDCDGNWSGWGAVPYADPHCTSTVMDIGAFCGPE